MKGYDGDGERAPLTAVRAGAVKAGHAGTFIEETEAEDKSNTRLGAT